LLKATGVITVLTGVGLYLALGAAGLVELARALAIGAAALVLLFLVFVTVAGGC
jgi:hypothetical protein